jgi:hypothetical protein
MGGFRASDADREHSVHLIESAYVDGQLGELDRDLRLDRARGAATSAELDALTRDLRPVVRTMPPSRAPASVPVRRVRHAAGVLGGLGAFLVLVGGGVAGLVALFAFAVGPGTSESTVSGDSVPVVVGAGEAEVAPAQVERVVREYEQRFGTTTARTLVIGSDGVVAHVPAPDSPSRTEEWSFDDEGGWELVTTTEPDDAQVLDLADLDPDVLVTSIAAARDVLGRRAVHVEVAVADPGDGPRVTIEVRSGSGTTVRLVTTLGGDVADGPARG